jgi:hypothetical protein
MIHDVHMHSAPDLRGLPDLVEETKRKGGKIVMFQRVTSLIFISWQTTHVEWVPPYSTGFGTGLRYTIWTLFLGWWSLSGFFATPAALVTNVLGGIDISELAVGPPPLPGKIPSPIIKAQAIIRQRFYHAVLIEFILIIFGIVLFVVWGG